MTTLDTVGEKYLIKSEKVDDCLPNWEYIATSIGIVGAILSAIGSTYFLMMGNNMGILLLAIALIFIMVLCLPMMMKQGCGIKISLISGGVVGLVTIEYTTYQFSGNGCRDVKKIQKIVDGYKTMADRLIHEAEEQQRLESEKEQLCCTQYQDVVALVKEEKLEK